MSFPTVPLHFRSCPDETDIDFHMNSTVFETSEYRFQCFRCISLASSQTLTNLVLVGVNSLSVAGMRVRVLRQITVRCEHSDMCRILHVFRVFFGDICQRRCGSAQTPHT